MVATGVSVAGAGTVVLGGGGGSVVGFTPMTGGVSVTGPSLVGLWLAGTGSVTDVAQAASSKTTMHHVIGFLIKRID
jgi:hypothetical protein